MPNVIKAQEVQVSTKEGECNLNITLDLNINLQTGELNLTASEKTNLKKFNNFIDDDDDDDKVDWKIPEFKTEIIPNFGKKSSDES